MTKFLKNFATSIFVLLLASCATAPQKEANDLYANSVKVTNATENHGGTGVVLRSTNSASLVLTNSHVCGVLANGGVVVGRRGRFQVVGYKQSEFHDLCLVRVAGNLGYNTNISKRPPFLQYENATISGHPALMPNVITRGHFSGREIIQVLAGVRECTEEDMKNPNSGLICFFLGGMPIIKSYESILVTATIMAGSSGSGVYNSEGDLAGLVFAGSGQLSYAWTVPYEAVVNFLYGEITYLPYKRPNNTVDLMGDKTKSALEENFISNLRKTCGSQDREKIQDLCALADSNLLM